MQAFSCLIACYEKAAPGELAESLGSLAGQTVPPNEVVLVEDGVLTPALYDVIEEFRVKLPLRSVRIAENKGLGYALDTGLRECSHELVARMDADDICHPTRFEQQLAYFKEHPEITALGGWIQEFEDKAGEAVIGEAASGIVRELPTEPEQLARFAVKRCPLNHPTVMFRKSHILQVGGYQQFRFQQDYHLWGRLLRNGYQLANLPVVLLYMRVSEQLFARRGGWRYLKNEIAIQRDFLRIGFISRSRFCRNVLIRATVRLIPNALRRWVYVNSLRKKR